MQNRFMYFKSVNDPSPFVSLECILSIFIVAQLHAIRPQISCSKPSEISSEPNRKSKLPCEAVQVISSLHHS